MNNEKRQPGTPPNEAWEQMRSLLDAEMPVNNDGKKGGNKRKWSILLLLLLIVGCGAYRWMAAHSTDEPKAGLANISTDQSSAAHLSKAETTPTPPQPQAANNSESDSKVNAVAANAASPATTSVTADKKPTSTTPSIKRSDKTFTQTLAGNSTNTLATRPSATAESNVSSTVGESGKTMLNADVDNASTGNVIAATEAPHLPKAQTTDKQDSALKHAAKTATAKQSTKQLPGIRKQYHVGLEWNTPFAVNNRSLIADPNGNKQPLILLIPTLWVSRTLGRHGALQVSVNPYAQMLTGNKPTLQSADYAIGAVSASNINRPSAPVRLSQTYVLNKVIGVQARIDYNYTIGNRLMVSAGIGHTWANTAVLSEQLVKNGQQVLKDSLYGIVQSDKQWNYINESLFTGRVGIAYRFGSKVYAGAAFSQSLNSIGNVVNGNSRPANVQLMLRYSLW